MLVTILSSWLVVLFTDRIQTTAKPISPNPKTHSPKPQRTHILWTQSIGPSNPSPQGSNHNPNLVVECPNSNIIQITTKPLNPNLKPDSPKPLWTEAPWNPDPWIVEPPPPPMLAVTTLNFWLTALLSYRFLSRTPTWNLVTNWGSRLLWGSVVIFKGLPNSTKMFPTHLVAS